MKLFEWHLSDRFYDTKALINGFVVLILFAGVFACYLIHFAEVKSSERKSYSGYVEKAARLYAALISSQLDDKIQTEKNILFVVQSDDDVKDVFVVNKYAGIIAPVSKAYQVVQDADLDKVLLAGQDAKFLKNKNSGKIYLPLFDDKQAIKSVVIISFAMTTNHIVKSQLGMFIFVFIVLVCVAIFISKKLNTILERPWLDLAVEVEDALNGVPLRAPTIEVSESLLDKHHFLYFRMLSKIGLNKSDAGQS